MRRILHPAILLLGLLLGGSGVPHALRAQTWAVKANPLSVFVLTGSVAVERTLGEKFSGQVTVFAGRPRFTPTSGDTEGPLRIGVLGLSVELRYFPGYNTKVAPEGFFLSPYLRARQVSQQWLGRSYDPDQDLLLPSSNRHVIPGFGMGGLAGYALRKGEHFAFDAYGGMQYLATGPTFTALCPTCDGNERMFGNLGPEFMGIEARVGIGIGYSW